MFQKQIINNLRRKCLKIERRQGGNNNQYLKNFNNYK